MSLWKFKSKFRDLVIPTGESLIEPSQLLLALRKGKRMSYESSAVLAKLRLMRDLKSSTLQRPDRFKF